MRRLTTWALVAAFLVVSSAWAYGTVEGEGRFEVIKGRPGDYVGLYEWDLYLSANNGTYLGQNFRLGTGGLGGGRYSIDATAGPCTIYVTQPIFFARSKLVRDVYIPEGQTIVVNPELCIDYACYEMGDGNWTEYRTPWYQTFIATGTSINRIQWKLAGWDCDSVRASVHEDVGGSITTWPQVGASKSSGVGYGDAWTGYRSGDIPTTPGDRYCIKLTGQGGSGTFAIRARNEDGSGYALGQAYDSSGNPRSMDLHITVFSDNDKTVVPYADMDPGNVESLAGSAYKWGQSFQATEVCLAAADCFIAAETWDIDVTFRVRQGGPYGGQVGPTKTGQALYQASTCGIVGVSYERGEVPLVPGQVYHIEMTRSGGGQFNAYKFASQAINGYAPGDAYKDSVQQWDTDLEMTIMEYQPWWTDSVVNQSFEDGGGSLAGWIVESAEGEGPEDPPYANGNPYGLSAPDGSHFAGRISTDWDDIDFTMGQVLEVPGYDPGAGGVDWSLSTYVQMHASQSSVPWPDVVHQVWELGYNADGSLPIDVDDCDNWETLADVDGDFTGNDRWHFYPLSGSGTIPNVQYVVLRVHCYNDFMRELCMIAFDDISLDLMPSGGTDVSTPPGFYSTGWNLTSVPLSPEDPEVSAAFADLVALGNNLTNSVYAYEQGSGYVIYPGAFQDVELGGGYWMHLTSAPPGAVVTVTGEEAAAGVEIPLADGWTLFGHPFASAVTWSGCQVTGGTQTRSLADAEAVGWIQSTIYYYDGGYSTVKIDGTGDDDSIRPWYGYWMLANQPGLTLIVPQP